MNEAERWREALFADLDLEVDPSDLVVKEIIKHGSRHIAAALEARDRVIGELREQLSNALDALGRERTRIAELEDLRQRDIERIGEMDAWIEVAEPRIAELEAGLRRIADEDTAGGYLKSCIARDLLAGRAAGGEG